MTDPAVVSQRWQEFNEKLTTLIHDYKDAVAPDWDADAGHPCHHDEPCECVPKDTMMAAEFVVIVNWLDMEINEMVVAGYSASHMRMSHTIGLLEYYRDRLRP